MSEYLKQVLILFIVCCIGFIPIYGSFAVGFATKWMGFWDSKYNPAMLVFPIVTIFFAMPASTMIGNRLYHKWGLMK